MRKERLVGSFFYQNMASRAIVLPAAGLAATMPVQRGNGHCQFYIDSSFLYSRTRRGYITRRPCPRPRARGTRDYPAGTRGPEIFKLSLRLMSSCQL